MKEHRNLKFLNFIEILCRIGHQFTNNQVYKACQDEISEKAQKSLITPIMSRLHRLKGIETKEKSVESFFEICVIRERK